MKYKKYILLILLSISLLLTTSISSFAHSGRTDGNGGHRDNINGGYHYHHGYPAHDHPDGECPYLISEENKEKKNSKILTIIFLCVSPLMALFPMAILICIIGPFFVF